MLAASQQHYLLLVSLEESRLTAPALLIQAPILMSSCIYPFSASRIYTKLWWFRYDGWLPMVVDDCKDIVLLSIVVLYAKFRFFLVSLSKLNYHFSWFTIWSAAFCWEVTDIDTSLFVDGGMSMYVYDTVQRNSADCYGIQIKRKCT